MFGVVVIYYAGQINQELWANGLAAVGVERMVG
jgi:hypothetical protein